MRSGALVLFAFLVFAASAAPVAEALAQASRCRTSNCFNDSDVRDFEVVNDETMIIYVGRQRCPFLVRVNQISCDLTFIPDVHFIKTRGRTERFGSNRICIYETGIALDTAGFGSRNLGGVGQIDPASGRSLDCRVQELRPVTDDELIEIYVDERLVAPPPPIGTGEISRSDDQSAEPDNNDGEEGSSGAAEEG
jgi:hypothetical protein